MELTNLNHCTSLIPSSWEWASLVLHLYDIANLELGEGTGVLRPLAEFCLASGSHSGFPVVQQSIPVWMEMELARMRSLIDLANTAMAGEIFVMRSGVLR